MKHLDHQVVRERILENLKLLSVPSATGTENVLADRLERKLRDLNLRVQRQPLIGDLNRRFNVIGVRGENPKILFSTHMDTVPHWGHIVTEGFELINEEVYMRGILDTKGQLASLLTALELSQGPVAIALFSDEEKDGRGSDTFLQLGTDLFNLRDLIGAIVLEPSELKVATSQWGNLEFEVWVGGSQAHGASLKGDNAIHKMIDLIGQLKEIAEERGLVLSVGKLEGGFDPQVVPDQAFSIIDLLFPIRTSDIYHQIVEEVIEVLRNSGASWRIVSSDPPIANEEGKLAPLIQTLSEAFKSISRSMEVTEYTAWTDAQHLIELGIPTVVLGAGPLHLAHTRWERLKISEMVKLTELIFALIEVEETGRDSYDPTSSKT